MSVASLAGYLANSGGGGGGSTYYNAYDIDNSTEPVQLGQATVLFGNGDITPPVGKYLVNTFITFRSYNADGDVMGFINNATVIVQYGNQIINNQINYSNAPYENNSIYCIQTSGVFNSIGTDSIIITAIAIDASGAETYNILTGGETISQVQIIGLSGSGGGGGAVNSINAGLGIIIEDEGAGDYTIINDGIVTASAGAGIDLEYNSSTGNLTITNTGAGEAITLVEGAGISIVQDPPLTYTITNTGGGGGGDVSGIVEGTGTTVVDDGQGVFTINNSGVLKLTAGDGIGLSAETGEITITNTGGGGDVNTITAGTGIDITDGGNGDFTINNSGVLALTAGDNITITGTKNNYTIATGNLPYVLGGKIFTADNQNIPAGSELAYKLSSIPNVDLNPNTIATLTLYEKQGYLLLTSLKWDLNTNALTAYFYNFSTTDITGATFNFSVIAMNY